MTGREGVLIDVSRLEPPKYPAHAPGVPDSVRQVAGVPPGPGTQLRQSNVDTANLGPRNSISHLQWQTEMGVASG